MGISLRKDEVAIMQGDELKIFIAIGAITLILWAYNMIAQILQFSGMERKI